jgi:holdfast attachment protein HfaA
MANKTAPAHRLGAGLARAGILVAVVVTSVLGAQGAAAQTMNANSASFNAGFGRNPGDENRPVNVQLTDGSGNSTLVNGLLTSNSAGSIFSEVRNAVGGGAQGGGVSMGGAGAGDSFSGAGGGSSSASAIGNSLNVIVQGDNNTVIVNATQTNNGAVTATTSTSGK